MCYNVPIVFDSEGENYGTHNAWNRKCACDGVLQHLLCITGRSAIFYGRRWFSKENRRKRYLATIFIKTKRT